MVYFVCIIGMDQSLIKKSAVEDSEEEGKRENLMIFFEKMPPDSHVTFLQMHLFYSSLS